MNPPENKLLCIFELLKGKNHIIKTSPFVIGTDLASNLRTTSTTSIPAACIIACLPDNTYFLKAREGGGKVFLDGVATMESHLSPGNDYTLQVGSSLFAMRITSLPERWHTVFDTTQWYAIDKEAQKKTVTRMMSAAELVAALTTIKDLTHWVISCKGLGMGFYAREGLIALEKNLNQFDTRYTNRTVTVHMGDAREEPINATPFDVTAPSSPKRAEQEHEKTKHHARRASYTPSAVWIWGIVLLVLAAIFLGYFLTHIVDDPYRTLAPLDVEVYRENSNSLRGNVYKIPGTIFNMLASSVKVGRLVSVDVESNGGNKLLPLLIPPAFNHINIQKGQQFIFKIEVDDKGILKVSDLKKA